MSLGFGARPKSVISMTNFAGHSNQSSTNTTASVVVPEERAFTSHSDIPTPEQFELFIPWIFTQWQCLALVAITKKKQEIYTLASIPKKKLEMKIKLTDQSVTSVLGKTSFVANPSVVMLKETEKYMKDTIPIETYYDPMNHLVGVRIADSPMKLPVELTRAFHICFPYHPRLIELSIFNSRLSPIFLYDLGLLLPLCNLTEVLLDDNYVKEGNYYCLLDEASKLRYLSLKRCRINDVIVSKILKRLVYGRPAEKHLMLLDLTSNNITDVGAKLFGELLRRNRRITYLNLSGNMINDEGALAILKHLKEFPLTDTEIIELRQRRMKYYQNKIRTYERPLIDNNRKLQPQRYAVAPRALVRRKQTPQSIAGQKPPNELMGPFIDLFDDNHTIIRDSIHYCTGNFRLAWLNLAYNNISYRTVKELTNVLQYQSTQKKYTDTGLVRVVIEGNYLPIRCNEYSMINEQLNRSLVENVPVMSDKKRFGLVSAKRAVAAASQK